jgi:peptide/nickel transport system substrate-binding protein
MDRCAKSLERVSGLGSFILILFFVVLMTCPKSVIAAQGERLIVAVPQWGTETPFWWKSTQAERTLWDHVYDPFIMVDPKTTELQPCLATEWKPSPDNKTWTFKIRQGVQFHENWGELTSEDVKYTIEQNLRPDAVGLQAAPLFKVNLEKIETPDKYTIVMHFKSPLWEIPKQLASFRSNQTITSKKYFDQVGEEKASQHPIGTGPYRHIEGRQGDFHRFQSVPNHWRKTPDFKELVVRKIGDPATRLAGVRSGEIDIALVEGDFVSQAKKAGLRIVERPDIVQYWVVLRVRLLPTKRIIAHNVLGSEIRRIQKVLRNRGKFALR